MVDSGEGLWTSKTRRDFGHKTGGEQHKNNPTKHIDNRVSRITSQSVKDRSKHNDEGYNKRIRRAGEQRREAAVERESSARGADREEGKDEGKHASTVEDRLWSARATGAGERSKNMKGEINELRGEISIVDREIRAVEKEGSNELEGATTKESKARQKEECFRTLVQARMRTEADARTIAELEGKLKEMGGL